MTTAACGLVYRPELMQAGGVMHGGAIASLLDSVLVPAIGASLPEGSRYATVDLHVQFMEGVIDSDVVAEGWVVRRGRRVVFGQAEATAVSTGRLAATAVLTYAVSPPPGTYVPRTAATDRAYYRSWTSRTHRCVSAATSCAHHVDVMHSHRR